MKRERVKKKIWTSAERSDILVRPMRPTRAPLNACVQVLPDHAHRKFWEVQRQFFVSVGFMSRSYLLPRPGKNAKTFASRGLKDAVANG